MNPPSYGSKVGKLSNGQLVGAGLVVGIHMVFFWALQNGVAQKSFEKVKKTIEATIITEPKLEPPKVEPPQVQPKVVPKVEVKPAKPEPKAENKPEAKVVPPKQIAAQPDAPKQVTPPNEIPAVVSAATSPISVAAAAPASVQPAAAPTSTPVAAAPVAAPTKAVAKTGATFAKGSCDEPAYPAISARAQEEGSVLLEFTVSPEGKVIQSKVLSSSGFPRLDEAAKAAYGKCKFAPATADGVPVQGSAKVRYTWTLSE
jgi:periplasmic protein TonB